MVLFNVSQPGVEGEIQFRVNEGTICEIKSNQPGSELQDEVALDCAGAIVFPGLINSHDHLDFNLFPRMRNRIYNNYSEWGKDIHLNNRSEIDKVLKVPAMLRTSWGIYKNPL